MEGSMVLHGITLNFKITPATLWRMIIGAEVRSNKVFEVV